MKAGDDSRAESARRPGSVLCSAGDAMTNLLESVRHGRILDVGDSRPGLLGQAVARLGVVTVRWAVGEGLGSG
jgi:hypothetical protein